MAELDIRQPSDLPPARRDSATLPTDEVLSRQSFDVMRGAAGNGGPGEPGSTARGGDQNTSRVLPGLVIAGADGATPSDSPALAYRPQNVYAFDPAASARLVTQYGGRLDASGKTVLSGLVNDSAQGTPTDLSVSLAAASPRVREAYATMLRQQMGMKVELTNRTDGTYSLTAYEPGHESSNRMVFSSSRDGPNGPVVFSVESQFVNARGPLLPEGATARPQHWMQAGVSQDDYDRLMSRVQSSVNTRVIGQTR